jgi:hypothetical protein
MVQRIGRPKFGHFGFYIVIIFVATAAWQSQSYMTSLSQRRLREQSQGGIVGTALTQLNDVQQRQLDAYLEVNRLLTTFGTAILGAFGFLLLGQEKPGTWQRHRLAVVIGVLCVAVSIFFGYVAYLFIQSMLRDGLFDLTSLSPHWAQQAHFYTFLAGVIFLADFVYHNLIQESGRENPHEISRS